MGLDMADLDTQVD